VITGMLAGCAEARRDRNGKVNPPMTSRLFMIT